MNQDYSQQNRLPTELVSRVIDFLEESAREYPGKLMFQDQNIVNLDVRDTLLSCCLVNHDWYEEARIRLRNWYILTSRNGLKSMGSKIVYRLDLNSLSASLSREALRITWEKGVYHEFLTDLDIVLQNISQLDSLILPNVPMIRTAELDSLKELWTQVLTRVRDLKYLDLGLGKTVSQWALLSTPLELLKEFPKLKTLRGVAGGHKMDDIVECDCQELEFGPGSVGHIDDNFILDLALTAPRLSTFCHREEGSRLGSFGIQRLAELPIKRLEVGGGGWITTEGLRNALGMQNLTHLNLSGFYSDIADGDNVPVQFNRIPQPFGLIGLVELKMLRSFDKLIWLDLSHQPWLDVLTLKEILKGCGETLETLRCIGCDWLLTGTNYLPDNSGLEQNPDTLLTVLRDMLNPKKIKIVDFGYVKPRYMGRGTPTIKKSFQTSLVKSLQVWLDEVDLNVLDIGILYGHDILLLVEVLLSEVKRWPKLLGLGPMPGRFYANMGMIDVWNRVVEECAIQGCKVVECVDGCYSRNFIESSIV